MASKTKITVSNYTAELDISGLLEEFMPIVESSVKSKAPIKSGEYSKGITSVIKNDKGVYTGYVYNKEEYYLGHFLEFGTSKMNAQPHYRPAYSQNSKKYEAKAKKIKINTKG